MVATQPGPRNLRNAPPQVVMIQMISGYRAARALYVAAKLDIAELLADGPRLTGELAEATNTNPRALYRLLRALASLGIFQEDSEGRFALTELAGLLRADAPDSMRATARAFGENWHWQMWGDLFHSVKTGQPAFEHRHGTDFFSYCDEHPELAKVVNESKTSVFGASEAGIMASYDFSGFQKLVEVGFQGGYGSLLTTILQAYPRMQGVLYDLQNVVDGARPRIDALGLTGRTELVAGNCLESVPTGGDGYVLKGVIHNWDDERAVLALGNCREAMGDGKLLVCEMLMPPGNDLFVGKFIDIESLLLTPGGRERNEAEYAALFATAGLDITGITRTEAPISVIEAVRR